MDTDHETTGQSDQVEISQETLDRIDQRLAVSQSPILYPYGWKF